MASRTYRNHSTLTVDLIVSFDTGKAKRGLCSSFMAGLEFGDYVYGEHFPQKVFTLPTDDSPLVLIANGSGIAPFRGLWQLMRFRGSNAGTVLFFGCRTQEEVLFRDETEGVLTSYLALSRENGVAKEYVQQRIAREAEVVRDLVNNKNAHVYVCGGVRIPTFSRLRNTF